MFQVPCLMLGTKDGRVLEPQMLPVYWGQTLFHPLKFGWDTEVHPVWQEPMGGHGPDLGWQLRVWRTFCPHQVLWANQWLLVNYVEQTFLDLDHCKVCQCSGSHVKIWSHLSQPPICPSGHTSPPGLGLIFGLDVCTSRTSPSSITVGHGIFPSTWCGGEIPDSNQGLPRGPSQDPPGSRNSVAHQSSIRLDFACSAQLWEVFAKGVSTRFLWQ